MVFDPEFIPVGRAFGNAPLGLAVHIHDAMAGGIAQSPFVVIHQRPQEIADNGYAVLYLALIYPSDMYTSFFMAGMVSALALPSRWGVV